MYITKRFILLFLATILLFTLVPQIAADDVPSDNAKLALPTTSTVLVNGKETVFEAYCIDGYNYFKLRDLAYV